MARLFVMCGIPGSGKSTWAKQFYLMLNMFQEMKLDLV